MIYIFFVHFVSYIIECYGPGFTYCTDNRNFGPLVITQKIKFILVLGVKTATPVRTYTNFYYMTVMH